MLGKRRGEGKLKERKDTVRCIMIYTTIGETERQKLISDHDESILFAVA